MSESKPSTSRVAMLAILLIGVVAAASFLIGSWWSKASVEEFVREHVRSATEQAVAIATESLVTARSLERDVAALDRVSKSISELRPFILPPGAIAALATDTRHDLLAERGWLPCAGGEIDDQTLYDDNGAEIVTGLDLKSLRRALGTKWGHASAGRTKLPDLRGMFLRGAGGGHDNRDKGPRKHSDGSVGSTYGVGTTQAQSWGSSPKLRSELAGIFWVNFGDLQARTTLRGSDYYATPMLYTKEMTQDPLWQGFLEGTPSDREYGYETRPINAAVNFIIKY